MKLSILTAPGNGSPLILAHSLKSQLEAAGHDVEVSTEINTLNRLVSYKNNTLSFHFWLWEKLHNYFSDKKIIRTLKRSDAVVLCECIPNAYWKRLYNVEKLKKMIGRPVFLYEVYYLANAPSQIETLKKKKEPLLERYDGHLFVSSVTETRSDSSSNAFCIGIRAKEWDLEPLPKKDLVALVDFAQPGYELYRRIQIAQLKKAGIDYISLEKVYTIDEIRNIYRQAAIFFVQFPEAFGLPILECLCTGAQVFTPDSGWPMSWRKDENPKMHGPGELPGCFTVYEGADDLYNKLIEFKTNFNKEDTPMKAFNSFIRHYPTFYNGDKKELQKFIVFLDERSK